MTEKLPQGWVGTELQNLSSIKTGNKDVNEGDENGKYPFFTCAQSIHRINEFSFEGKALLVAGNGFFNVKYYDGKFDAYQRTYVLQNFKINFLYLYWFIELFLDEITKDSRGSTIKYIRLGDLAGQKVVFPPLNEQKRIVARLDAIMPKINAVKERLENIPTIIKRFRQSVLTAAVTGKLTEKWREENPEVESAEILLKQIEKERRLLFKEKKNSKLESLNGNSKKEGFCAIANSWMWCKLAQISLKMSTGPFGTMLHKSDYVLEGIPVINPTNITNGKLFASDKMMISGATFERLKNYSLAQNDVVIARRGDLTKCAVVTDKEEGWLCGTGSFFLKLGINSNFFSFFYESKFCQTPLNKDSIGSTMANLNQKVLSNILFPLPPLEEQKEIVRQVEKLFAIADKLEDNYQKAKERVDKLSQSVLAKAFRGELVAQDLNDEPAEKLLERILAEKAKMEAELKAARKKSRTNKAAKAKK